MNWIFTVVLGNILVAVAMSCGILLISRKWRNPFVLHALWVLVLVKLVTPPLLLIPCLPDLSALDVAATSQAPLQLGEPSQDVLDSDVKPAPYNRLLAKLWMQLRGLESESVNEDTSLSPSIASKPDDPRGAELPSSEAQTKPIGQSSLPLLIAGGLWFVGFAWSLFRIFTKWRQVRLTIRMATSNSLASTRFDRVIEQLSERMGLRRPPKLVCVDAVIPPLVWLDQNGAKLVVPKRLLSNLTDEQFEALVAHELAHIQSHHVWFRRFELLVKSIYWWFPPLHFVMRKLRQHEEEICDARVVQLLPSHVKQYAHLLVDTSAYLASTNPSTKSLVLGMSNFQLLERRVSMIINNQIQTKYSVAGWLVFLVLFAGLPLSLVNGSSDEFRNESTLGTTRFQDEDLEAERLARKNGAKDFTEFGLKGEVFMMASHLGLEQEAVEAIRNSLDDELQLAVKRGLAKKHAPIGFFKHVDPELQSAVWEKAKPHLSDDQRKKLAGYVKGLEKHNALVVQLSQKTISAFLDKNLGLTLDQLNQIDELLAQNWEPSWRGVIFSGADYPLAAEGALNMLPKKTMESILNTEQYRAFVDLESYVFDVRKLIPLDDAQANEHENMFERLEKTCDRIMILKIEELKSECKLTASQAKKLRIAAKGAVASLIARFQSLLTSSKDHNQSLEDPKYFSLVAEPLVLQCSAQDIWVQAVENTLSEEQKAIFDAKIVRRLNRERSRLCHYTMLYFNRARQFSYETQVAAAEMLIENLEYSSDGDAMYNLLAAASKIPEEKWKQVIPEDKWPMFEQILQALKQMTPGPQNAEAQTGEKD